ncbi:SIR2 family NAD-dependent protein deacylase [Dongia deserti]|uniref:SIR2 family NAD-dependent protein deacylase n=1 Tax=Dongia deserti TaxID=2268030 RepID=UPI000E6502E1|nr:NAD-dependent deacylase [Dongia deserti]
MAIDLPFELIDRLRVAKRIVAFTGAGISAESGLSTFRDKQTGLWAQYRPEDLATPQAFRRNPRMVWEWYEWRRGFVAKVEPNPGHHALARIEAARPGFFLVTQNVDGLHARAGSRNLVELHGNIRRTICFEHRHLAESWEPVEEPPPRCERCGGLLRPDVVWFGEALPENALRRAQEAAAHCDLFLSIGTSTLVYPAAELPFIAGSNGATVIEINPDFTPLSKLADFVLREKAGVALPAIAATMLE